MKRSGVQVCSLDCIKKLNDSPSACDFPAIGNLSRKRPANHGTPPDSEQNYYSADLEADLAAARLAAGTNLIIFLSNSKAAPYADAVKNSASGNQEKAGLSVVTKKNVNIKDLDEILNTAN